jgi:hypothetical protein
VSDSAVYARIGLKYATKVFERTCLENECPASATNQQPRERGPDAWPPPTEELVVLLGIWH